jgi:EpsI family protein
MEQPSPRRIIAIIALLAVAGLLVHWTPVSHPVVKKIPLRVALESIEGWKNEGFSSLDSRIIEVLNLDDYTNASYSRGQKAASLYVGYYLSTRKVGAAHSPLVCLNGQGWVVKESSDGVLPFQNGERLNYSYMVVERGGEKQLIVYWYQSCRSTCSSTVSQKVFALWNKLAQNGEDNAFVRVGVNLADKSKAEALSIATSFIEAFYPRFIDYISN